jgi:hypothetical protein
MVNFANDGSEKASSFYWTWFKAVFHYKDGWHRPWAISAGIATALSIVIPAVAHRWPELGKKMGDLAWEIPVFILAGMSSMRIALAPYWIYRDSQKEKLSLRESIDNVKQMAAEAIAKKQSETDALKVQLGESHVSCKMEAVYISQMREYHGAQGPTMTRPSWVMNYTPVLGHSRVILDLWFCNDGGIPTNVWGFKLSVNVVDTGIAFSGVFLKDQRDGWYITRPGQMLEDEIFEGTDYSQLAVDWEIDNDDLLKRGNPKQCWVHFAVKGLIPQRYENVNCILEFRDAIREYKYPFTKKFFLTQIEHRR